MYKSKIFLVGDDEDTLIALSETDYATEDVLQTLVAKYPDLLPGDQIDPENPRRWLLVEREMGVPDDVGGNGRWSLDHLFLDQDGIPTFVECKRAVDTRARREVVAQMLDYAANGVEYWSVDRLRQAAAEHHGDSLDDEIGRLLDTTEESDIEAYWDAVETNLRNHRVRLVFVADSIPKELRRLVEFLNEEMGNVEVLAVEIKQFQRQNDAGQKAIVPRVVGLTETARSAKKTPRERAKALTPDEFLERCSPEARIFFPGIWASAEEQGYEILWNKDSFSLRAFSPTYGGKVPLLYGKPPNTVTLYIHSRWADNASSLREKMMDFGFQPTTGNYTVRAFLTKDKIPAITDACDFYLGEARKYVEPVPNG